MIQLIIESLSAESERTQDSSTKPQNCSSSLTKLDAFLYGLPGGLLLAGILFICFLTFGYFITGNNGRKTHMSVSSNTKAKDILGKKNKRGPPPSADLRLVDMNQMALREDAPDDIREMARTGKLAVMKSPHNR